MREAKFDVNDEILRPYFPLPQVMEGLFQLVNKLFGIQVEAADGLTPIWNKDVRFFKISKDGVPQVSEDLRTSRGKREYRREANDYTTHNILRYLPDQRHEEHNSLHEVPHSRMLLSCFKVFNVDLFCGADNRHNFFSFSHTSTTTHTQDRRRSVGVLGWMRWWEGAKFWHQMARQCASLWLTWCATNPLQLGMLRL